MKEDKDTPLKNVIDDSIDNIVYLSNSSTYRYTKKDIDNLFKSENGQKEAL